MGMDILAEVAHTAKFWRYTVRHSWWIMGSRDMEQCGDGCLELMPRRFPSDHLNHCTSNTPDISLSTMTYAKVQHVTPLPNCRGRHHNRICNIIITQSSFHHNPRHHHHHHHYLRHRSHQSIPVCLITSGAIQYGVPCIDLLCAWVMSAKRAAAPKSASLQTP